MGGKSYVDLIAWQKAMDLIVEVYRATEKFPTDEKFGLTAQVRRAAVSIAANIAEGQGRFGDREFVSFLSIAHGSLRETETHLHIASRLGYCSSEAHESLLKLSAEVAAVWSRPSHQRSC
jgi:four helix bundle protein